MTVTLHFTVVYCMTCIVVMTAWRPSQSTVNAVAAGDRFIFDPVVPRDLLAYDDGESSGELTPGADEDLQSPLPLQDPVANLPSDNWEPMPLPEPIAGYEQARYHRNSEYDVIIARD